MTSYAIKWHPTSLCHIICHYVTSNIIIRYYLTAYATVCYYMISYDCICHPMARNEITWYAMTSYHIAHVIIWYTVCSMTSFAIILHNTYDNTHLKVTAYYIIFYPGKNPLLNSPTTIDWFVCLVSYGIVDTNEWHHVKNEIIRHHEMWYVFIHGILHDVIRSHFPPNINRVIWYYISWQHMTLLIATYARREWNQVILCDNI
jgi:hypothetical protein